MSPQGALTTVLYATRCGNISRLRAPCPAVRICAASGWSPPDHAVTGPADRHHMWERDGARRSATVTTAWYVSSKAWHTVHWGSSWPRC